MPIRLNVLADQLGSQVGGGTFTNGFVEAIERALSHDRRLSAVNVIVTQGETAPRLSRSNPNMRLIRRRIPARCRFIADGTALGMLMPRCDVAHGLFGYGIARRKERMVVTVHDLSILHDEFHPGEGIERRRDLLRRTIARSDRLICSSDATKNELLDRYPDAAGKAVTIYPGYSLPRFGPTQDPPPPSMPRILLTVATIEPRKNFPKLLDAFDMLTASGDAGDVELVIVGTHGWRSESVIERIERLESKGSVRWIRDASDDVRDQWYRRAHVFTYLSVYEGFGYPPFEAAAHRIPMVLSDQSAVGEIWRGYTKLVNPSDVAAITDSWRKVLSLQGEERVALQDSQQARLNDFVWNQVIRRFVDEYASLG